MSLVVGYSSSESEEEPTNDQNKQSIIDKNKTSSSSSSSENEEEQNFKLPLPGVMFNKKSSKPNNLNINQRKLSENSVFSNSFAQSEATIQQTLSKHTKLSEISPQKDDKHQRKKMAREEQKKLKLCMHFFKHGTCKYGDKCKFSHKLLNQPEKISVASEEESVKPDIIHKPELYKKSKSAKKEELDFIPSEDDECSPSIKKAKKRPGLGNDIIPGKKVLKSYEKSYK